MAHGQKSYTPAGNLRPPALDTLAQWVLDSWNDIEPSIVIKSFKKCCISNAMNGTEDDMLWEDVIQDRQVAENEDEIDDVVDQDDPYDDNLPQAEWEELFNGIHADDI